jgi:hypothetical protein
MNVTVFRDKFARGWPRHEDGERGYVVDLGLALDRAYTTDAHFVCYATPNGRRLVREALDQGVAVELNAIVFDIDCPDTHGTPEPAPHSWRRELGAKVWELSKVHPDPYFYGTRGGGRIVYRQAEPTVLRTQNDATSWARTYAVALAYLVRRFGIAADPACFDWQRHYRLPRATRDRSGEPENYPYGGDHTKIGVLTIDATDADVTEARSKAPRSFRHPRATTAYVGNGDGLLFYLLRARGDIVGSAPRDGWICRCPNRGQHTLNTDGSDSSVVFPPNENGPQGTICCLHGHCAQLTQADWLRLFTDEEISTARAAAGTDS